MNKRIRALWLLLGWLFLVTAQAASFVPGQPLTAAELNNAFANATITSGTISGATITNSTIDNSPIGQVTPAAGTFTTLTVNSTIAGSGVTANFASPPPIGSTQPNTGAFTTLSASSSVSGAGFTAYLASPPAIGSNAPAAGSFTALAASSVSHSAGSAAQAPAYYAAGTNLTTPVAGAVEYDGTAFYATPVNSNRGVLLLEHVVNSSSVQTGTNGNGAQPWFAGTLTSGQITLPSLTTYEFEGLLPVATTGTTSHSIAVGFGGTATFTSIGYFVQVQENATSLTTITPVSRFSAFIGTAASTVVTTAVPTATYDTIEVRGTMRINAGGTVIPQFAYSSAPGAAPTIAAGAYFRLRPLGSNTATTNGNWN